MQEPDLNKMWQTWIRIEGKGRKYFQDTIREKIQPILQLEKQGEINWFYFLFHPMPDDPAHLYFDVIFTTDKNDPNKFLPQYCIGTAPIPPKTSISGIDKRFLDGEDVRKAWRIIGEQSEFIINLVCSHKKEIEIPPTQIAQFMHFFMNPLGYGMQSVFAPGQLLISF